MFFNHSELEAEIRQLHEKIQAKRMEFDKGMKEQMSFVNLRSLYSEIRIMEKRLELCFEEANVEKGL